MDEKTRILFFRYLSVAHNAKLSSVQDLMNLSPSQLLDLGEKIHDETLPLLMQVLKEGGCQSGLFQKLMGDGEVENQERANHFFARYEAIMMEDETEINTLIVYLPPESWDDLAFLQSREIFFLRQTMGTILEFFDTHFETHPVFLPGQEKEAWNWFFNRALMGA